MPSTPLERPRGLSACHADEEERVREIMVDKSTLTLKLLSKDNWIKNEMRSNCYYCRRKFRPFVRKHHCRGCGDIVCSNCNRHRNVQVAPHAKIINVRLCFDCIDKAMIMSAETNTYESVTVNKSGNVKSGGSSVSTICDSLASLEYSVCEDYDYEPMKSRRAPLSADSITDNNEDINDDDNSLTKADDSADAESQDESENDDNNSSTSSLSPEELYEQRRLKVLASYNIMDSAPQREYEALCELASRALGCTVAAVGFIDQTRQWYKARIGIAQSELPRGASFCAQTLRSTQPTVVLDLTKDARFRNNPLVTGNANIRFYASTPICDSDTGVVVGTVFALDPEPKAELPSRAMEVLAYLKSAAERLLVFAKKVEQGQSVKRNRRGYSTPGPNRPVTEAAQPEMRAGSLQSVPEEIAEIRPLRATTTTVSTTKQLDKNTDSTAPKPESTPEVPEEETPDARQDTSMALALTTANKVVKTTTELAKLHPQRSVVAQAPETMCLDLLCRITDTQQILAQQQRVLLGTLTDHSKRIGTIEKSIERIEDIVDRLQHDALAGPEEIAI
ncbi:TPA: hypothetical protein N0F65_004239 [Lagenidium giganteum]|uniref:FYVE-type domain-containing protein n=1 Tax=Lagenidium giganteum TaxID=4803 RepID=A0AAV2ZCW2_9STRA|nr:TPA: hypothetical protein N0F65_004239 [Lagenidium giganteum]